MIYQNMGHGQDPTLFVTDPRAEWRALRGGWGSTDSLLENVMLDLGPSGWGDLVRQRGGRKEQQEGRCGGGRGRLLRECREGSGAT